MTVSERELITTNENEQPAIRRIEQVLAQQQSTPKLVGPDGTEIELPFSVFQILKQVIYHLLRGRAVSIVPINKELTTQEAADILNISRPYLVKLLEAGQIPFTKVGSHRRVRFSDVLAYQKQRENERKQALAEIAHISEDAELYD